MLSFDNMDEIRRLLPAPFGWRDIPAGSISLKAGGYVAEGGATFYVPAFRMARYPGPHAQFRKFVDGARGYQQQRWWTGEGWELCEREGWVKPRTWTVTRWIGDDCPVSGVSWYEALAFCRWLSEAVSETISLPTEQQWQRAAQALPDGSDSGYVYPWGNEWDASKCNNSAGRSSDDRETTPVTQYEGNGNSPCGVVDMSGNVWEWCLTAYATGSSDVNGTGERILRGGSLHERWVDAFRADERDWGKPSERHYGVGFRVAWG